MVRQCKSHHWHLSAAYIQGIKAIEVMGTQAPWRQEKEHFMNPQTVIYSLLSLTPVCTHEFPCYLMCLCDIKGTVSENSCLYYVLYTETTIFQASAWEAELLILVYVFMAFFVFKTQPMLSQWDKRAANCICLQVWLENDNETRLFKMKCSKGFAI